ncbi:MAG: hypothetical protein GX458_20210 [Phyllobacteriaceae bacterium]|nr:hypothetical protein [Phyllobacteriaceae bacterium]
MTIAEALEDLAVVLGARSVDYGAPNLAFDRIARLWSVALGVDITPRRVALLLALMKAARLVENEDHEDGWADLAGYAVIGAVVGRVAE